MMHVKVLFSPDDGTILGAQVAGFDGVDKRLDVFATAIRAGHDGARPRAPRAGLRPAVRLGQGPRQHGRVRRVQRARGDLELWYAQDYPEATDGARIIDVRGPDEFGIWHIPGAENVPLKTLRAAQEGWDKDTPIRLYCAVGFRSYLAYRSLVQRGFTDVKTLSGGSTTFRAFHDVDPTAMESTTPMISYAEEASSPTAGPTGVVVDLDCTGLACPGPIMRLTKTMLTMAPGDEVLAHVSDPGFALDAPAWAQRNGHQLVEITPEGPGYAAKFRKGGPLLGGAAARIKDKKSFVVFSGDLDKLLAAFIIANGAVAMGDEVSMFFTFWGLNALKRPDAPKAEKSALERAFGVMMPSGPDAMPLSTMNMLGGGPAMIKKVMRDHNVPSLPELIGAAKASGVRMVACTMTMDLLGIREEDLIDGVELGGVATFLGEANESNGRFFI